MDNEENKSIPLRNYKIIRARIDEENTLITQRLNWLHNSAILPVYGLRRVHSAKRS